MVSRRQFTTTLFYSYSHKDSKYREKMEESLALLRHQDGIINDWSDTQILPGQPIPPKIQEKIKTADIFVFLLSPNFLASAECRREWSHAQQIAKERPAVFLVPVILSPCQWKNLDGMSHFKALPTDGKPIKSFRNKDSAWQQVSNGLRRVTEQLRKNFAVRDEFRREMETTDFLSQKHIRLQDIFVFPRLSSYTTTDRGEREPTTIENTKQLLQGKYMLIHGEELSGRTALCQHLFLELVHDATPVIYLDLAGVGRRVKPETFRDAYVRQFHGDYSLWDKQDDKTIVLDNLSDRTIDHVTLAVDYFDRVIVTLSTDTFDAYYKDDSRLAEFQQIEIMPLTHSKQEQLIRKRMDLSGQDKPVLDGQIDQIENRVNEIIINNRILPRYPFYVLSILQTYEGFMPNDLSFTSFGHCYYIMILAHLLKSGVSETDDEINACLNLSEYLAFEIYRKGESDHRIGEESLDEVLVEYKSNYVIKESTLNRLFDSNYGIVNRRGQFRSSYMYYYFLGKFLARNGDKHGDIIERMCDRSYITANCLTLVFTIHHTSDGRIIDDILLRTMCALDEVEPSVLDREEAEVSEDIVAAIPSGILSGDTVEAEREKVRNERDNEDDRGLSELDEKNNDESVHAVNDVYRIMKNTEILGQILKNKYGSLERRKVAEIIETIADGRLRLVRLLLGHQKEMNEIAGFIHKGKPTIGLDEIKRVLRFICFLWTMHNIERAVGALNKPEIRSLVEEVVSRRDTPAYGLIGYFLRLDTIDDFSDSERRRLNELWGKYRYEFFRKVISIRTQIYLNTHRVQASVEQAVCSLLNVKFQPRLKKLS